MATWRGSARRARAAVDVVMHGTVGLTGELERRAAHLDGEVTELRGQVAALQSMAGRLEDVRAEVAALAGPAGRLIVAGSPWWSLLPFTTHRIQIAPGLFTAETGVEPHDDLRTAVIVDTAGGLACKRVLDAGCLEGGFSVELGRQGAAEVVGVEVRPLSVRRCELARDLLGLDHVRFVCGDVLHEIGRDQEPFDIILATGILYHLAHPDVALRMMRERCRGFVLLCTHVAHPDASSHGCSDDVVDYVGERGSYRGRSYSERGITPTEATGEGDLWASWSNEHSFWPFADDLVRMVEAAGFSSCVPIDPATHSQPWQVDHTNRVLLLCHV